MFPFRDLSIRLKLIVLLGASAAIALSISALMSLSLTIATQRSESLHHLQQIADIASENLTAAVAFNDKASAARMLASLRADPQILAAIIHDEEAQPFSVDMAPAAGQGAIAPYLAELADVAREVRTRSFDQRKGVERINFDYMSSVTPIAFEGKIIGTLTLVSGNRVLKEKIGYYVLMQAAISLLTLVIIVLISIRLQRVFTHPIFHIIDVIRKISETKDYAVSVETTQKDEFKALFTHFNHMIAEIHERDGLLSRLATTDPLTGLANRRHAMDIMQTMVTRAHRKGEFFGLAMFDVDHFKQINDQYGHPVGDAVLKEVATTMAHTAREYDLVARIGGEEFLLLCDNSDLETTSMIAERMRVAVEQAVMQSTGGRYLRATISGGVYAAVPVSEDFSGLLKIADDALYHAKNAGRNQLAIGTFP